MSGDPTKAFLWNEADVLVAPLGSDFPADVDEEFSEDWTAVGILDGDAGFTESRSEDTGDLFGWGGILLRTTRKNFKLTKSFTALEHNDVTQALQWPGSPEGGPLVVPRPIRQLFAFETRDTAADTVHRLITTHQGEAQLDGDLSENETSIAGKAFIVTVFPNANGELWTPQDTVVGT